MKNAANLKSASGGLLVLVGPKLIGEFYYRIVSHYGGPYKVERFDPRQASWCAAPRDVRFTEVCNAPVASEWLQNLMRRTAPTNEPDGG